MKTRRIHLRYHKWANCGLEQSLISSAAWNISFLYKTIPAILSYKSSCLMGLQSLTCFRPDFAKTFSDYVPATHHSRIASHRIASHRNQHRIASHRIASHRIASHRIASHRIASHRIASHHTNLMMQTKQVVWDDIGLADSLNS